MVPSWSKTQAKPIEHDHRQRWWIFKLHENTSRSLVIRHLQKRTDPHPGATIRHYQSGAGPISPEIAHKILQMVQNNELTLISKEKKVSPTDYFDLSAREKQILSLLVQGLFYKEIADKLDISVNTAKKHVINIYTKLHVNSRAQALHIAYEKGLL